MMAKTFYSCDWGTTHFRLRLVEKGSARVIDKVKTTEGVASLAKEDTAEARTAGYVSSHTREFARRNGIRGDCCVISGMASSYRGWKALP